jgi:CDP-glucose 4,6-dehydratase
MPEQDTDWSGRRVLVTGASGFVGSWLVRALVQRQASVVVLLRDADPQSDLLRSGLIRQTSVVNGELEDYETVRRAINEHEVDTVFHLAAQAIVGAALRDPLPTFEANIRGTYHVLEAARVHAALVKAVVIASSDKAYGDSDNLPYKETHSLIGRHPYDVSKSCTDLIASSYYHTYHLPITIARCGNIYGGGDLNWTRIVPGTIRSLLRRERPILRSDGSMVRDYIFVEDAVDAYLALAEQMARPEVMGQAFNFSTESYVTVREIVAAIQQVMNARDLEPIIQNRASGEIRAQSLCSAKAHAVLGWSARHDLVAGLRKTAAWYRAYLTAECTDPREQVPIARAG